eukprot:TRINITY_DN92_c0_g1::TRINITY_DN92_c0_g1_i1::g.14816::m.14816 TRINITY_DN92_c0_g1::TRINITY_DN92_c0_g1_i1::g.14816  ORF type:complete len:726 (+),score=117.04,sp/Q8L751/ORP1C_ARATH/39.77/3e-163,Oxysterol_BP/PF01237.13/2.1e-113,PH_11/PF15413.1/1.2e-06,PH_11/PF15413.1/2.1e+03,PH/PF00169.24/0.0019,PH/PF00169.24/1.5e+04,PH/PF00169.24/6.8e+03,PH_8/PF15409.1/1.1e+02,PH_8/PF15409.1/4.9 TRINITY_DN92_c0_g1_i1:100-2277(+)
MSREQPQICGLLQKWVNFSKGFRPRLFILQDGVLRYHKVHGKHKMSISDLLQSGEVIFIGSKHEKLYDKEAHRKTKHGDHDPVPASALVKTLGAVHLAVATIRESSSDDRKFYLYTGTKTLLLRADTRDDKIQWLNCLRGSQIQLKTVSEPFRRASTAGNLPVSPVVTGRPDPHAPVAGAGSSHTASSIRRNSGLQRLSFRPEMVTDAVKRTRERLIQAGFAEPTLSKCLTIFEQELEDWRSQASDEFQRLNDAVSTLQADKRHLERQVVDRDRGGPIRQRTTSFMHDRDEDGTNGSSSDEDDSDFDVATTISSDQEFYEAVEGFYDATDSQDFNLAILPFSRRVRLPELLEKPKIPSLWNIIKDSIGMDLTKVCLPVTFNEPLSMLQKACEDLEYSELLDKAMRAGKDSTLRVAYVAAFAVSAYSSSIGRDRKPFNPLLGETYECMRPEKGWKFFSEKVCHNPVIMAYHCSGRGWSLWGDGEMKSKFMGQYIDMIPVGALHVQFDDGQHFTFNKVTTTVCNVIIGKLYVEHHGTMTFTDVTNPNDPKQVCSLKFKQSSIWDKQSHQVRGNIMDGTEVRGTVHGTWDEQLFLSQPDAVEPTLLWRVCPHPDETIYNMTLFALQLNEITPDCEGKLAPTDSRLRPDQRHLENGFFDMANKEKLRLEQKQREARKLQEGGWKPRWFTPPEGQKPGQDDWRGGYSFTNQYWDARDKNNWEGCRNIFGL